MSNPQTAWHRLRAGNRNSYGQPPDRPVAAVFRCSDARLPNEKVFGADCGPLIDVSIWGHAVDTSVLASLEYAVDTLEVPLVVVLGHDDCAVMHAALQAWDRAELPDGAMSAAVEHALSSVVRRGAPADSVTSVGTAHIVDTGLTLVQRSPVISRRVDDEKCGILCATYHDADRQLQVHATIGALQESPDRLVECV
jgi:carbonic anhydrase